ncbi:hypothetical protein ABT237_31240 [Streptomyces sp. NPDC001581]|uniref:hypothetical protein n=1 Tax=Streptomyces sp. NPDC001581 TaxID=3154386 RepID=UPI00331F5959
MSLGWIAWSDEEYRRRRSAYGNERADLLPELPKMPDGEGNRLPACCGCVGIVLTMFFWCLASVLLVAERPHGVREWTCAVVAGLGLLALLGAEKAHREVRARTECGDPLGDLIRAEPHPAFEALDEQQRLDVLRSSADHFTWRGVDQIVVTEDEDDEDDEDDEWLDDKVWWEDAYEYRATDEDEPETRGASSG